MWSSILACYSHPGTWQDLFSSFYSCFGDQRFILCVYLLLKSSSSLSMGQVAFSHNRALFGLWQSSTYTLNKWTQSPLVSHQVWNCIHNLCWQLSVLSRGAEMFCLSSCVENGMSRRIKGWKAFLKTYSQCGLDLNLRRNLFWQQISHLLTL